MAILKYGGGGYSGGGWNIITGDTEFDDEMGDQLNISTDELAKAINSENVTDALFARILINRSDKHERLMKKVPGVKKDE